MDISERIERIYRSLAAIPVSGDLVEVMAGIRADLREVYREVTDSGGQDDSGT